MKASGIFLYLKHLVLPRSISRILNHPSLVEWFYRHLAKRCHRWTLTSSYIDGRISQDWFESVDSAVSVAAVWPRHVWHWYFGGDPERVWLCTANQAFYYILIRADIRSNTTLCSEKLYLKYSELTPRSGYKSFSLVVPKLLVDFMIYDSPSICT